MAPVRIAILGAGNIGGTLGRKWARAGHSVAFGVLNPQSERARALRAELGAQVSVGTPAEALERGDVVLLAVPGAAVEEVVRDNAALLDHKIIIDSANSFQHREEFYATRIWNEPELNNLRTLHAHAPHAQLFRAFNSYEWQTLDDPYYQGVQADLFYCGAEGEPRALVERLIGDVGLRPVCLGDERQVDLVDEMLRLWANLAFVQGMGRNKVAIKVLAR